MTLTNDQLTALATAAISGDIFSEQGGGFVSVMAKGAPSIKTDIPAAFEMYALLNHFADTLPSYIMPPDGTPIDPKAGIWLSSDGKKIVAMLPISEGQLSEVAFWLADSLPSREVKAMPGLLALPFVIEVHDEIQHLLPEWFAAFYVKGKAQHCIPMLSLKSVMNDQRFGGDWVAVAIHRMNEFALPQSDAEQAAGSEVKVTK